MRPCAGRRHEERIGRGDRQQSADWKGHRLVVASSVSRIAADLEAVAQLLPRGGVDALPGLTGENIDPRPVVLEVGLPGEKIPGPKADAALSRRDGVGRDIAARGRVEHHDVAGVAVVLSAVSSTAPTQVRVAGEPPFRSRQRLPIVIFVGDHRAAAGPSPADRLSELILAARAVPGVAQPYPGLRPFVVVTQDDVHHAAHRVGAVEGRGPVEQNIDASDRGRRDRGDIGEVALGPGAGQASTVDQDERGVAAQAAKVHAVRKGRVGAGPVGAVVQCALVGGAAEILRQAGEQLGDRRPSFAVHLVSGHRHHGRRAIARSTDQASRDDHFFQLGRFGRLRFPRRRVIEDEYIGPSSPMRQAGVAEQRRQGGVGLIASAEARRSAAGDESGRVQNLLPALLGEGRQSAIERACGDVIASHRLRGLRDHRRRRRQEQRGQRCRTQTHTHNSSPLRLPARWRDGEETMGRADHPKSAYEL